MTATLAPTTTLSTTQRPRVLRTGLVAAAAAAIATSATAAIGHAAGVALAVGGDDIPVVGFANLTFVFVLVGTAIAAVVARRSARPRAMFLRTTIALTVVSFLPDAFADATTSTRLLLAFTHVVAAAIAIPALASRLHD